MANYWNWNRLKMYNYMYIPGLYKSLKEGRALILHLCFWHSVYWHFVSQPFWNLAEGLCFPRHSLSLEMVHTTVLFQASTLNSRVINQDKWKEGIFDFVLFSVFPNTSTISRWQGECYTEETQCHGEFWELGSVSEQWLKYFMYVEVPVQTNMHICA